MLKFSVFKSRSSFMINLSLALLSMPMAARADLLGVSWFSFESIYRIDEKTGLGVPVGGETGVSGMNSLARDRAGDFYSLGTVDSSGFQGLLKINPRNGAITPVVAISDDIRALAFSKTNILYGIRAGAEFGEDPSELVTINTSTGAVKAIGSNGGPPSTLQGLAFSPSGTLYGWDVGPFGEGQGLVTVNPLTGALRDVNPIFGGSGEDIQNLTFAPDGTLYGGRNYLYKIDMRTGDAVEVGGGNYIDLRGIEYINPIPEPSACLMQGMGLAVVGWRAQTRTRHANKGASKNALNNGWQPA